MIVGSIMEEVEGFITALRDPDEHTRQQALDALVEIGAPAIGPLISALSDTDTNVRELAAEVLGGIGDPRAVEPLIAALRDPNETLIRVAARALGQIGDRRAVEPLISVLRDSDERARRSGANALAEIGDPQPLPQLERMAKEDRSAAYVARRAVEKIRWRQRPLEQLIAALHAEDVNIRWQAAEALGKTGDPHALRELEHAAREDKTEIWTGTTVADFARRAAEKIRQSTGNK